MMLGSQIRKYRIARGMLQRDLAALVGVSRFTVVRWENGKFEPKASQLADIATVLSVKENWLLHPEEEGENDQSGGNSATG